MFALFSDNPFYQITFVYELDRLQSLFFFINASYHILVASLTLMALFLKQSRLQVYDMAHWWILFLGLEPVYIWSIIWDVGTYHIGRSMRCGSGEPVQMSSPTRALAARIPRPNFSWISQRGYLPLSSWICITLGYTLWRNLRLVEIWGKQAKKSKTIDSIISF